MKSIPLLVTMLLVATNLSAKGVERPFAVDVTSYSDGVLLLSENRDEGLQVSIAGPDGSVTARTFSASDPAFLYVNETNGQALADGLYRYEVWPIPAVTYTREESAAMPDRNDINLNSGPSVSPINGSFRVEGGMIVDAELTEGYARVGGAEE